MRDTGWLHCGPARSSMVSGITETNRRYELSQLKSDTDVVKIVRILETDPQHFWHEREIHELWANRYPNDPKAGTRARAINNKMQRHTPGQPQHDNSVPRYAPLFELRK